jgi:aminopeptidase N
MKSIKTLGLIFLSVFVVALNTDAMFAQPKPVTKEELREVRRHEIELKQKALEQSRLLKSIEAPSLAQSQYDAVYYRLNLDIDPVAQDMSGIVEMTAIAKANGFVEVELDLYSNLIVDAVNGDAASFSRNGNKLMLQLSQPRQSGESFTISVNYHGQPQSTGFGAFTFSRHQSQPIIWTLSEPYFARTWWPCKDAPNDKADSVDVIVTVPADLTVASNGVLRSVVNNEGNTRTFHWHESYPITTYLVSLAITNYLTFSQWFHYAPQDSMEVRYYIYPENIEGAMSQLTETIDMLTLFHEIFGPYPFIAEKYGIAQFPRGGGMEHQTITSQGTFGATLTAHELAHQWWGDKITNATWGDIWLNEGFASYSEALYYEHTLGHEYYHTYMGFMAWEHPYPIFVDDTTSVGRIFDGTVYDKGAWFLHMLRHIVGDETFFDILLAYSNDPRFAYGNATTGGFQNVCETVSGRDLDWFFQPWIYEAGRPIYRGKWHVTGANPQVLQLTIEQIQPTLFPMPIDITIETTAGDTVVTVFNDAAEQAFSIPVSAQPTNIILDEDGWILKRVQEVLAVTDDPSPLPTAFALNQNFPNPFNGETVISFSVPQREEVVIRIYNLSGQQIRALAQQSFPAGTHRVSWDGRDDRHDAVASGLYFYQMHAGEFTQHRKMLLIR